jgi:hypothetical protein
MKEYVNNKPSFFYRNGLSLAIVALFLICIAGQAITGWHEYNKELAEYQHTAIDLLSYLTTGHFIQTTFENWESEFLQMGMYVVLTIFLRQKGSSESKHLVQHEEVDRKPDPKKHNAPWPVKRGGIILILYQNSLSIAFGILFIASFWLHACGSLHNYNHEQQLEGKTLVTLGEYLGQSRFWYESFQNWQSEFIAVLSIVVLSIFLRQKGSPESKPVDAPNLETGTN